MFIILISIVIIICVGEFIVKNSRNVKLLNTIPEPWRLPLIGHALNFYYSPTELFYMTRSLSNKYKSAYKIGLAHLQIINSLEPDDIEIILSNPKCINKSLVYKFMVPWINDGLLLSTGDKWKNRRKFLGSAFHYNRLKQFLFVFNENSEKLISKLQCIANDPEVDVMDLIVDCALHDICDNAMGINLEKIDVKRKIIYKQAIKEMSQFMVYRSIRIWLHSDFIFGLTGVGKKQKNTIDDLHDFTSEVIRQKRDMKTASKVSDEEDVKARFSLLDLLLTAEKEGKIDDAGIKEEVDTFMFGGHDTTTSSIICCLMLLANNPEHQDIVYKEIIDEFGEDSVDLTIAKFNNLSYLERCIKETLRLYPSVPLISRLIKEDIQLTTYTLPAGTIFQIHIYDLHRKACLYPDPDKFDPDRFLPENCEKRHPYSYLPFSAGPKNCMGQKYTILEQKVIISSIVKHFKLIAVTKPEDVVFTVNMVLKPKYPIKIKIVSRH